MEEGEVRASSDAWPTEGVTGLFRAGPERDPIDPRSICPFLAREGSDGTLEPAPDGVDTGNRCTAIGEPVSQSARQQQLVCLVATHVDCPRYQRGLLLTAVPASPPAREPVSRAVIGAFIGPRGRACRVVRLPGRPRGLRPAVDEPLTRPRRRGHEPIPVEPRRPASHRRRRRPRPARGRARAQARRCRPLRVPPPRPPRLRRPRLRRPRPRRPP